MSRRRAIVAVALVTLAAACGSSVQLGGAGSTDPRSFSWPLELTYELRIPHEGHRQVVRFSGASWLEWAAEHHNNEIGRHARCQVVLPDVRWTSNPAVEDPDGCNDIVAQDSPIEDSEIYPDGWFLPITPHGADEHPLANHTAGAQELVQAEIARLAEQLALAADAMRGQHRGCVQNCAPDEPSRLVIELADARVPLANIEYRGGERFAWMEVTSIEPLESWHPPATAREQ